MDIAPEITSDFVNGPIFGKVGVEARLTRSDHDREFKKSEGATPQPLNARSTQSHLDGGS
jgi:hypothetical protein